MPLLCFIQIIEIYKIRFGGMIKDAWKKAFAKAILHMPLVYCEGNFLWHLFVCFFFLAFVRSHENVPLVHSINIELLLMHFECKILLKTSSSASEKNKKKNEKLQKIILC